MKSKAQAFEPFVGIWWDDGKTLVALAHSPLDKSSGSLLRDSDLQHLTEWPTQAKHFSRSSHDAYESVPRGRVVFDTKTKQGIIYHGSATTKKRLRQIAERYQLTSWKAVRDPHYAFGDEIDELFQDE